MADLLCLLQGMLHPDLSQRLSISALLENQQLQTRWLNETHYKANTEDEIGAEMR